MSSRPGKVPSFAFLVPGATSVFEDTSKGPGKAFSSYFILHLSYEGLRLFVVCGKIFVVTSGLWFVD